mmetsp:Transcript_8161/g.20143  ORF Transcript_8161/g.20143 Transcript_8161/m.20143 type:complete len:205 (-) Transcript_8161:261-875(-)
MVPPGATPRLSAVWPASGEANTGAAPAARRFSASIIGNRRPGRANRGRRVVSGEDELQARWELSDVRPGSGASSTARASPGEALSPRYPAGTPGCVGRNTCCGAHLDSPVPGLLLAPRGSSVFLLVCTLLDSARALWLGVALARRLVDLLASTGAVVGLAAVGLRPVVPGPASQAPIGLSATGGPRSALGLHSPGWAAFATSED